MDWIERMNAALDYIEENLAGEIDMAAAASRACCSEYHFTRFFSFIADLPLNEYIRRRRLTMAGFMLQKSTARVIDIALLFGYDSPNSFSRAFQAMHSMTPTEAREFGVVLKPFPRISFSGAALTPISLEYRIVSEDEHTVFGKSFVTRQEIAFETVAHFLDICERNHVTNRIVEAAHGTETTLLNSLIWDADDGLLQYMFCLDMPSSGVPVEFETMTVPARTWAVFPLVIERPGEDSIISVWKRIWTEWFPSSGYEQDTGPRQERCHWREDGKMAVEAWVPVVKSAHS